MKTAVRFEIRLNTFGHEVFINGQPWGTFLTAGKANDVMREAKKAPSAEAAQRYVCSVVWASQNINNINTI
jgi:hypothetical protein